MALAQEPGARWAPSSSNDNDALVVETVRRHAEKALSIARRCTQTPDDALEAYSRALLKLVRYKDGLRPETVQFWLFEVVRREAGAVRKQSGRLVAVEDGELQLLIGETAESPEERVLDLEVASRAGEALAALKPDEARALTLQAAGLSYGEIAGRLGWTATKTNRALTEGRAGFRRRYAELESGEVCRSWAGVIAEGRDAPLVDRARLRAHLRGCPGCRATVRELHDTSAVLAVVLPVALAGPQAEGGPGFVARAADVAGRSLDAVAGIVAERTTGVTVQLHALTEAASAAKLAAVAASAVAVAGGGVAVHEATRADPRPERRVQAPVLPTRTAPPPEPAAAPPAPPAPTATTTTAQQAVDPAPASRPEFDAGASSSRAGTQESFAPPPPPPAADIERARQGGGEFGGGGGEFGG